MLIGLEVLVERMKTHPDEFMAGGRWVDMLVNIDAHLTEEERQALKQGFSDAAREKFNELVLKLVANEAVDWREMETLRTTYEGVMAYPMEQRKLLEVEEKYARERQLANDKLRLAQQVAQQQHYYATQSGYNTLLGNQASTDFWR